MPHTGTAPPAPAGWLAVVGDDVPPRLQGSQERREATGARLVLCQALNSLAHQPHELPLTLSYKLCLC